MLNLTVHGSLSTVDAHFHGNDNNINFNNVSSIAIMALFIATGRVVIGGVGKTNLSVDGANAEFRAAKLRLFNLSTITVDHSAIATVTDDIAIGDLARDREIEWFELGTLKSAIGASRAKGTLTVQNAGPSKCDQLCEHLGPLFDARNKANITTGGIVNVPFLDVPQRSLVAVSGMGSTLTVAGRVVLTGAVIFKNQRLGRIPPMQVLCTRDGCCGG